MLVTLVCFGVCCFLLGGDVQEIGNSIATDTKIRNTKSSAIIFYLLLIFTVILMTTSFISLRGHLGY